MALDHVKPTLLLGSCFSPGLICKTTTLRRYTNQPVFGIELKVCQTDEGGPYPVIITLPTVLYAYTIAAGVALNQLVKEKWYGSII